MDMEDELHPEYNFSQMQRGIRGKYVERYRTGTNIVRLDPDVVQAFPNDTAVNEAFDTPIDKGDSEIRCDYLIHERN